MNPEIFDHKRNNNIVAPTLQLVVELFNGMVLSMENYKYIVLVGKERMELYRMDEMCSDMLRKGLCGICSINEPHKLFGNFFNETKLRFKYNSAPIFIKELFYNQEFPDGTIFTLNNFEYVMVWGETKWRLYMLDKGIGKINFLVSAHTQEQLFRSAFSPHSLINIRHNSIKVFTEN